MNYELEIPMRETGPHLAVSIGTALAIEIFGGHAAEREPEPESRHHPEELWINLRTLVRNLHSGQDARVKQGALPEDFIETLEDEMRLITEYVRDVTAGKVNVLYYACEYDRDLRKRFPKGNLKEPSTPGQLSYVGIENAIVDHYSTDERPELVHFRGYIKPSFKHAWVLTSSSVDLLDLSKFKRGLLLESHTGRLKNTIQLHSKLTNGSKMGNVPFNKMTLQVFGDKSNLFSPMPKAVKDAIQELAKQHRWTPATSTSNVKFAINGMKDRLGSRLLLELMR